MTRAASGLAVTLALLAPATATANFRFFRAAEVRVHYYPAPPVYYTPCPVIAVPVVAPPAPGRTFATPTPAPPSPVRELIPAPTMPPAGTPLPGVSESRFSDALKPSASPQPGVSESRYYDVFPTDSRGSGRGSSCNVAFWNLTGRELVLHVDGQRAVLPPGKQARFELGRQFVWKVEGREAQLEKVPASETGLEVVLRR